MPFAILFLCLVLAPEVYSQTAIFNTFSPVDVEITAPFTELFSHRLDKDRQREPVHASIRVGDTLSPALLRMRGHLSLSECSFPKLALKIRNAGAREPTKVDLGTHCVDSATGWKSAMTHNFREALIYRWQRILGLTSLRSRPVRVSYRDTNGSPPVVRPGFLLEHLDSLLARNGATEILPAGAEVKATRKRSSLKLYSNLADHPQIDTKSLTRIAVFQALIGNTDWWLLPHDLHNVRLITRGTSWVPLALDFNMASIAQGRAPDLIRPQADYFNPRDAEMNLELTNTYQRVKPQLYGSLECMNDDPEGQTAFRLALDRLYSWLGTLKT